MSKAKSEITREEYLVTLNLFARSTQEERDHGPLRADLIAHVDALRQQLATARQESADAKAQLREESMDSINKQTIIDGLRSERARLSREQAKKEQP